ncbi:MAG: hypothetical protein IKA43_03070, partial [Clostridia bacterium]|nr:hypothetical protein [Clostridia bacterium]
ISKETTKNGCIVTETTTTKVFVGDTEKFTDSASVSYESHNDTKNISCDNGKITLINTCSDCSRAITQKVEILKAERQSNGEYYATYTFTPTKTGIYTMYSASDNDTYATLSYAEQLDELLYINDDDSGVSSNFLISYELEAGKTYVYKVGRYNFSDEIEIPIVFVEGAVAECDYCGEGYYSNAIFKTETENCESGVIALDCCTKCTMISRIAEFTTHQQIVSTPVKIDEGCGGSILQRACLCGKISNVDWEFNCEFVQQRETEDVDGETVTTDTYTCANCTLKYVVVSKLVQEGCDSYFDATHTAYNGDTVICEFEEYSYWYTSHSYDYTYYLTGDDCSEDGVERIGVCSDCGDTSVETIYHHEIVDTNISRELVTQEICDGHSFYVMTCKCGKNYEYFCNDGLLQPSTDDSDIYECSGCDLTFTVKAADANDSACYEEMETTIVVAFGSEELYKRTFKGDTAELHAYVLSATKVDQTTKLEAICSGCSTKRTSTLYSGTPVDTYGNGEYVYEFSFAPEVSGYYTVYSVTDFDTYAELWCDSECISVCEDEALESNFALSCYLEAGKTYTYYIYEYSKEECGAIDFIIVDANVEDFSYDGYKTLDAIEIDGNQYNYIKDSGIVISVVK